jgi:putative peptidoglycan lipid II flippase
METGATTVLTLAQRLYQFPLGVFGIAIATAIFPALARAASGSGDQTDPGIKPDGGTRAGTVRASGEFAEILRRGLRLTLFIGLPASVGLVLVREPLTRVFFEWGEMTRGDALRSAAALAGYGSAVWAYSLTHVVTRAFYAVDDAATPLRVSVGMVGFNLVLNLLLIWPLGVAGLAWSTAISATLQSAILLVLLRKHVDRPVDAAVGRSVWRTVAISVGMGLAVAAVLWPFDLAAADKAGCLLALVAAVATGMGVVGTAAWAWRMPELGWLRRG